MFASARVGEVEECGDPYKWVRIQQFTKKQKTSQKGSLSFCCQTRIRRSACACCNDCCSATLSNRTSSLSPQIRNLRGPFNGFESSNLSKNERPPRKEVFHFVAKLGFEPRQTEPESVVLPLHHLAIPKGN